MFSSEFWWLKDKVTEGHAWWERYGKVGSGDMLVCKREEGFESLYNNPLVVPYPIPQKRERQAGRGDTDCHPSTQHVESGGLGVGGQPGLERKYSENLSLCL